MTKGFVKAKKSRPVRLIVSAEGTEKEGKTSFGLSAPDPIALLDLDTGLEGVVDKFIDTKDIRLPGESFNYRDATNQNEWLGMWTKMKNTYFIALDDDAIRTVVIDTETESWELIRLARFGKLLQVQPWNYGPVNAEYRDMLKKIMMTDKNLILLHRMRDEYIDDKKTGGIERAGFKETSYFVQVNVRCWKDKGTFGLTVLNCRQRPEIDGLKLTEPMNTFPFLAAEVFPDTDPEDWE